MTTKVPSSVKTHHHLRNLHEAYVYATEVQLDSLRELVRFPAGGATRIARQRSTCLGMLRWCASALVDHAAVDWGPRHERHFPRVSAILATPCLESGLDGAVARWRGVPGHRVVARPALRPRIALPLPSQEIGR